MRRTIFLVLLLSTFIYSKSCNLQNLNTLDKAENAQKCMIAQLRDLDNYFERYKKYHDSVYATLELLRAQGGNCRKWELLYQRTHDEDYKISLSDCKRLYKKRALQYKRVSKQYNRISISYEKLKEKVQGLDLKIETMKNEISGKVLEGNR